MKRFISLLLALILCLSVSAVAFADDPDPAPEEEAGIVTSLVKPGDSTQAEETGWYFRTVNGMLQMRLWSFTYAKWLTEWIIVGPAL